MRKRENRAKLGVLTEKGVYFDLWVAECDHQLLKAQDLNEDDQVPDAESILAKYLRKVRNLPYPDDSVSSIKLEGWGLVPFVPFVQNGEGKLMRVLSAVVETTDKNDTELSTKCSEWDEKNTLALISLVTERGPIFDNPTVKKVGVWRGISDQLRSLGYNFSGEACDSKWRHLKSRFYTFEKNKRENFKWQYFDAMKQALEKTSFKYRASNRRAQTKNSQSCSSVVIHLSEAESFVKKEPEEQFDIIASSQGSMNIQVKDFIVPKQEAAGVDEGISFKHSKAVLELPDAEAIESKPEENEESNETGSKRDGATHDKTVRKLLRSKKKKLEMSKIPVKYRGFAELVKKEQRKTRKLMKTLIKEQQKSVTLFEKFLNTITVIVPTEDDKLPSDGGNF